MPRTEGVYLITLWRNPEMRSDFCTIVSSNGCKTDLGRVAVGQWRLYEQNQENIGFDYRTLALQVMPDHIHFLVHIEYDLDLDFLHLVEIYKRQCTARLYSDDDDLQLAADGDLPPMFTDVTDVKRVPSGCDKQMMEYVLSDPKRYAIMQRYPDLMQRGRRVSIAITDWEGTPRFNADGQPLCREYYAYGNIFLLRWPMRKTLVCHRYARVKQLSPSELEAQHLTDCISQEQQTNLAYINTEHFKRFRETTKKRAREGVVYITTGMSAGEKTIMDDMLYEQLPLIKLQLDPIPRNWWPETYWREPCHTGRLLILAPTQNEYAADGSWMDSTAERMHNLNDLAKELEGTRGGMTLINY